MSGPQVNNPKTEEKHGFTNTLVRAFLDSKLSLVLILFSVAVGAAALFVTPREEDPQIVVPLADVHVRFPGHSAAEVEHLSLPRLKSCCLRLTASNTSIQCRATSTQS